MTNGFTVIRSAARILLCALLTTSTMSTSTAQSTLSFGLGTGYLSAPLATDLVTRFNAKSAQKLAVHPDSWIDNTLISAVKGNKMPFAQVPVASFFDDANTESLMWLDPRNLAKAPDQDFRKHKNKWRQLVVNKANESNLELLFFGPEIPTYRLRSRGPEKPHWTHIPTRSRAVVDRRKEDILQGKTSFHEMGVIRSHIPFHAVVVNKSTWVDLEKTAQQVILKRLSTLETRNWGELRSDAMNVQFLIKNGIECRNCMPGQRGPWIPSTSQSTSDTVVVQAHSHKHKHIDQHSSVVHEHEHQHEHRHEHTHHQ